MPQLVLSDLEDPVFNRLQVLADSHQRTPAEEARAILSDVLGADRKGDWHAVDAIFDRFQSAGKTFADSAVDIREDRDR
jgi:plasmid stability protein